MGRDRSGLARGAAGRRWAVLVACALSAPLLTGCVAAVVPVLAAAGALGKSSIDGAGGPVSDGARSAVAAAGPSDPADADGPRVAAVLSNGTVAAAGATPAATPTRLSNLPVPSAADQSPVAGSPYARFARFALAQQAERAAGGTVRSAVLVRGVSLSAPRFTPCQDRPLAVAVDLDASGAPLSGPLDPARSSAELATALASLRSAGLAVLWLSDRPPAQRAEVERALARAGYWSADDRLLLDAGTRKQERRWAAADDRCVVAIAGDRRGDMDELYDYLRTPEAAHLLAGKWDAGWFLAPAPFATE